MTTVTTLDFLGAAGGVTGSKHLVTAGRRRVLLDCGLFQGLKALRLRNWSAPPFDLRSLDAVVLSHAHLDHSGYLPIVARLGFRGPVFCTPATRDLLQVLLLDAAKLQEEDAEHGNRHGWSKHRPAQPLFTTEDAERALGLLVAHKYREHFEVTEGVEACLRPAGHILGSASVELRLASANARRLVFSGDLGRSGQPILVDPEAVPEADVLLVESTYGDREHRTDAVDELVRIVRTTMQQGGVLLVPAFTVGRMQTLIWLLRELQEQRRIPEVPVFIDSPMANRVSAITCHHDEDLDASMKTAMDQGRCPLCCKTYHLVDKAEESRALHQRHGPMIILAGNGMVTGGRILHHLERWLPDSKTTVLLVGFQAAGTRGRALAEGAKEIKMHGRFVRVGAKIEMLDGLSAHADQNEILQWLGGFVRPPAMTYVVHGEPHAADSLASAVRTRLGWPARVAQDGEHVQLFDGGS